MERRGDRRPHIKGTRSRKANGVRMDAVLLRVGMFALEILEPAGEARTKERKYSRFFHFKSTKVCFYSYSIKRIKEMVAEE